MWRAKRLRLIKRRRVKRCSCVSWVIGVGVEGDSTREGRWNVVVRSSGGDFVDLVRFGWLFRLNRLRRIWRSCAISCCCFVLTLVVVGIASLSVRGVVVVVVGVRAAAADWGGVEEIIIVDVGSADFLLTACGSKGVLAAIGRIGLQGASSSVKYSSVVACRSL